MKAYRLLLWVLALAALGALLYGLLAADPGYLLIEWRGYALETSLVAGLGLALMAWIGFRLMLALLAWPLRAWRRHGERSARRRLADGLLAAQRGEHASALKLLNRAARRPRFRVPAQIAAFASAQALDDEAAAARILEQLREAEPEAARLCEVEALLARGESAAALALAQRASEPPAPALRLLRMRAALAEGEASAAASDLRALKAAGQPVSSEIETAVHLGLLRHSPDLPVLQQRYAELPKAVRGEPQRVAAFCQRARALGGASEADDAIEQTLRRDWHEALAADYGRSASGSQRERIRRAEAWLEEHPDSPALQLALGRLCRIDGLWGKAEAHLLRACQGPHAALAWEELGLALSAQNEDARARQALANALAAARGEPSSPLTPRPRALPGATSEAVERRSSMGVPLLADGSAPEAH